jgi:hypothetical protein
LVSTIAAIGVYGFDRVPRVTELFAALPIALLRVGLPASDVG